MGRWRRKAGVGEEVVSGLLFNCFDRTPNVESNFGNTVTSLFLAVKGSKCVPQLFSRGVFVEAVAVFRPTQERQFFFVSLNFFMFEPGSLQVSKSPPITFVAVHEYVVGIP